MKKKTIVPLTLIGILLVALMVLAPYLFHKPHSVKKNTVIVSYGAPRGNPAKDISQTEITNPTPGLAPEQKIASTVKNTRPIQPEPRKIIPEKQPLLNAHPIQPKPRKIIPDKQPLLIEEQQPPQPVNHPVTVGNEAPSQEVKSNPAAPGVDDTSNPTTESSRWGVTALVTDSGVDGGVCYRLAELPILGETSLDVVVGTRQAGIGLNKDVYQNLGVGIIGTIAYATGDAKVGIYLKYSF